MAPPPIPVVVDVVVTRGNVLGPAGYSRVTTKDGGVFDLHRGKDDKSTDISDDAAFLWCRRGAPGETAERHSPYGFTNPVTKFWP